MPHCAPSPAQAGTSASCEGNNPPPSPKPGGRRGGPRGHVKATLPPCPLPPRIVTTRVPLLSPRGSGRQRPCRAVPWACQPSAGRRGGWPRNGAGRDPGGHRDCPWGQSRAPPCRALLLSPSRGGLCGHHPKGITPSPGQVQPMWHGRTPIPLPLPELSALHTHGSGTARDKLEQQFHSREG